jgi:uncharacterized protein YjbI with pentapeptide repeats
VAHVLTLEELQARYATGSRDFRNANLAGVDLRGADLPGTNLRGANLRGANLRGAHLKCTDLRGADLLRAHLPCANLRGANLQSASLRGANLEEADLGGASLQDATLEDAILRDADLGGANLRGANLQSASLRGANLQSADLGGAHLPRADLRGANLQSASLESARLEDVDLGSANLEDAILHSAYMRDATLDSANLRAAHLEGAHLQGANLQSANLEGAHLQRADLGGANLQHADLQRAKVDAAVSYLTMWIDIDLSSVNGLESVEHRGPSTIGLDTLLRSGGSIPDAFLRGCGVPEHVIELQKSLVQGAAPIEFYSCFISYSHNDEPFARRLHSRLQQEKLRVWYAPEDMRGGQKLYDQIDGAIRVHDKLLLVLSEASMASEWVATEISKARKRERKEGQQVLFPVGLAPFDAIRDWECFDADIGKDSAREVREYFIPDFSNWKDHDAFEREFAKLLRDLRKSVEQLK